MLSIIHSIFEWRNNLILHLLPTMPLIISLVNLHSTYKHSLKPHFSIISSIKAIDDLFNCSFSYSIIRSFLQPFNNTANRQTIIIYLSSVSLRLDGWMDGWMDGLSFSQLAPEINRKLDRTLISSMMKINGLRRELCELVCYQGIHHRTTSQRRRLIMAKSESPPILFQPSFTTNHQYL